MSLLELTHVHRLFDHPSGEGQVTVLRDVSLRLERGESLAVIGPSGSGKSTLLNIIGALDRPTSGMVLFEGRNLAELGDSQLSAVRNREIGFIFQLHHLLPQCTVLENVLIPTIPLGLRGDGDAARTRAKTLLEKVGLENRSDYFPAQLSGGELQRTAVVRALINRPKLVLADEPTGSLDKAAADALGRLLLQLNREEGTTLIVVTHSPDLAGMLERGCLLRNGTVEPWRPA